MMHRRGPGWCPVPAFCTCGNRAATEVDLCLVFYERSLDQLAGGAQGFITDIPTLCLFLTLGCGYCETDLPILIHPHSVKVPHP